MPWMGSVQAHTQQGQGEQKGCSAKAHTAASQASWAHEEPLLLTEESSGFPSASLGTRRSRYMWRENMNHSQSSERSESCAAAALQVLPARAIALGLDIIQFQPASWLLLHPSCFPLALVPACRNSYLSGKNPNTRRRGYMCLREVTNTQQVTA